VVAGALASRAWQVLDAVCDPEIPVISIRELGILRDVRESADGVEVFITPTYSGCPAMGQIEDDVKAALHASGIAARVTTQLAPAWTTDWMSAAGRDKLRAYGIAPPAHKVSAATPAVIRFATKTIAGNDQPALTCPHCGSENTTETSHFGSTACKSLHKCLDCLEPFDYFKVY
jgi:ring-1,2-phenylacetyl-CoA epoxidase subunit PaaD